MKNFTIFDIFKKYNKFNINKKVLIIGFIKNIRNISKNIMFLDINDGTYIKCIQIVIYKNLIDLTNVSIGCSVNIVGYISKSKGKEQEIEIIAKKFKILGYIENTNKYPLSSKNHNFEYLRKISHLRPRTYFFSAVSRIRNSLFFIIHEIMKKNKFIWIPSPIITTVDTEGFSNMFTVNYENYKKKYFFNKKVFLTVSGQLHAESYALAMSKVYTFGPVFRAENSNTRKHLSEFWMFEPEILFFKLNDIIKFSERFIKKIFKLIIKNNYEDLLYINKKLKKNTINQLDNWIKNKFILLKYSEIIKILNKNNFKIKWGENLNIEHENFLLNIFNTPIFLTKFPINIKPFYMKKDKNNKTVLSMDLIFPKIGEIIGGSEREDNFNLLEKSMNKNNIKNNWYLDLRKYGTIPHSGFGMGFERLILLITGINNIKDVSTFYRTPGYINY